MVFNLPMPYYFRREKLWIAMEFCGGGSLQDIYHGKFLSPDTQGLRK